MKRTARQFALLAWMLGSSFPVFCASFEVAVAPSRFELTAKPGTRVGQSLSIFNVGGSSTDVAIRTLDWTYSESGAVAYHDELLPGSCRPWVTLERRTIRVGGQGRSSFRFQVEVPADAPRGECRFMIALEGVEPAHNVQMQNAAGSQLSLPVSGRIAVAVYVLVNGAQPKLEVMQLGVKEVNGKQTPVITVKNTGDAHGRLEGSLEATNAKGQKLELIPEGTPVLAGQTRTLPLMPKGQTDQKPPELALPIKASGQLDWDLGSFKISVEFK